jgi:hypothetical protein
MLAGSGRSSSMPKPIKQMIEEFVARRNTTTTVKEIELKQTKEDQKKLNLRCRKLHEARIKKVPFKFFKGRKIGTLTVLRKATVSGKKGQMYIVCACDCGLEVVVPARYLYWDSNKTTRNCGCLNNRVRGENE